MSQRSRRSVSRGAQAVWWFVAIALFAEVAWGSPAGGSYQHHLSKRFFEGKCKGVYDQRIFAKLERICEDCYELFHEPSVHQMCKQNCYTSDIFKGCVDTLQLDDEIEYIKDMVKQVNGADPDI